MQLYLIRHGQSYVNIRSELKEMPHMDAELTERGIQQAAALSAWLKQEIPEIHALYASSMVRARQTADPIAQAYNLSVNLDDRLREIGASFLDHTPVTSDLFPKDLQKYLQNYFTKSKTPFAPIAHDVENSESYMHFRVRVSMFLEDLTQNHADDTIVVVCHDGVINAVFDHIFNSGPFRMCHIFTDNTGVTLFSYSPHPEREAWGLRFQNRTEHLRGIQ